MIQEKGAYAFKLTCLGLGPALDRALQRAVQCGFCLFIFLLADLALLMLDLKQKQLFLQRFQQHGRTSDGG